MAVNSIATAAAAWKAETMGSASNKPSCECAPDRHHHPVGGSHQERFGWLRPGEPHHEARACGQHANQRARNGKQQQMPPQPDVGRARAYYHATCLKNQRTDNRLTSPSATTPGVRQAAGTAAPGPGSSTARTRRP
ncbi:hypothetical protein G6F59_016142 [Rhizopus arrhizus]|nr:hypothetical protein G6F59_016142 [Rhizopus arrhizus]